jgi:hypothetical protein
MEGICFIIFNISLPEFTSHLPPFTPNPASLVDVQNSKQETQSVAIINKSLEERTKKVSDVQPLALIAQLPEFPFPFQRSGDDIATNSDLNSGHAAS